MRRVAAPRNAAAAALLCGLLGAAPPALGDPQRIQAMIDCGLWLSAAGRCLDPDDAPAAPEARPEYSGLRRDTYYFLGLQVAVVAFLYAMPESVSGWSEEQKTQDHVSEWWGHVSGPEIDEDDDFINYVLHPYWGAAYYVRARERGLGGWGAFWYSALLSTLYEAGLEAFFEPVSIQDMLVTPIVGSWLGTHFMSWREETRERMGKTGETRMRDRALLAVTDPLGTAIGFVDRKLGWEAELATTPFTGAAPPLPSTRPFPAARPAATAVYGLTVTVRW